ncbi:hypothetical protein [uncultured Megasphaera sp.]|uniref:oxidoreductase n=1 Tax=uncultured Megasphaera sp. TaxID=165188 RepID=UPI00343B3EB7
MVVAAFADAAERTDAYGGSLEGLLRFPIEVYRAVRARVGADFPVTFRVVDTANQRMTAAS